MSLNGLAQFSYLDTIYKLNNYTSEVSYGSAKLSDNKFIIVGYAENTHYEINIFCITTAGDTLWNQQYNVDSLGEPFVVRTVLDEQKNILVAGYAYINNSNEVRALLLKTDSSGNLIWLRTYRSDSTVFTEYSGQVFGYIPIATFNNQYLLLCINGRDTDVANFMAIITDTMGNELTRWRYVNPYYEWPKFAIQTSDSGYLFGGQSNRLNPDTQMYFWTMYIKKVVQQGVLIWDTSIQALTTGDFEYTGDATAQDAIEVADGYVIAGERSDSSNFTYPNAERGWDKCWYGKLDKTDGHLIWEHYIGGDSLLDYAHFYGITQTADGDYALCGGYNYANNTRQHNLLIKTDANGDTLWSYILKDHSDSIQGTDDLELHRIYEIAGGYFATGFRIPVVALGDEFPYVLSVDTNGCPTYNCHNTIDTIPKDTIINTTFLIYPNPANTLLNILFTTPYNAGNFTFKIYDVSGRLLQTDEHFTPNLPYTVNVSNFANAIYFIEILNGKDRVGRGKFVKQ